MQEHLTQARERVPEHVPGAQQLEEVEESLREVQRQLAERDMQVAALTQQLEERHADGETALPLSRLLLIDSWLVATNVSFVASK